jgi:hypothetical protein
MDGLPENPSHLLLRFLDLEKKWLDTADGAAPNDAVDKLADQMDEVWMQLSVDERLYLNGRP